MCVLLLDVLLRVLYGIIIWLTDLAGTYAYHCTHTHNTHTHTTRMILATVREPALGYLCVTQVLRDNITISYWGRTSNPQEAVPSLTEGVDA